MNRQLSAEEIRKGNLESALAHYDIFIRETYNPYKAQLQRIDDEMQVARARHDIVGMLELIRQRRNFYRSQETNDIETERTLMEEEICNILGYKGNSTKRALFEFRKVRKSRKHPYMSKLIDRLTVMRRSHRRNPARKSPKVVARSSRKPARSSRKPARSSRKPARSSRKPARSSRKPARKVNH
jgi:hypothetical protein